MPYHQNSFPFAPNGVNLSTLSTSTENLKSTEDDREETPASIITNSTYGTTGNIYSSSLDDTSEIGESSHSNNPNLQPELATPFGAALPNFFATNYTMSHGDPNQRNSQPFSDVDPRSLFTMNGQSPMTTLGDAARFSATAGLNFAASPGDLSTFLSQTNGGQLTAQQASWLLQQGNQGMESHMLNMGTSSMGDGKENGYDVGGNGTGDMTMHGNVNVSGGASNNLLDISSFGSTLQNHESEAHGGQEDQDDQDDAEENVDEDAQEDDDEQEEEQEDQDDPESQSAEVNDTNNTSLQMNEAQAPPPAVSSSTSANMTSITNSSASSAPGGAPSIPPMGYMPSWPLPSSAVAWLDRHMNSSKYRQAEATKKSSSSKKTKKSPASASSTTSRSVSPPSSPKRKRVKKEAKKKGSASSSTPEPPAPAPSPAAPTPITSSPAPASVNPPQTSSVDSLSSKRPKYGTEPAEGWYEGCVPLRQPNDSDFLSELECAVREHLELFTATEEDIKKGVYRMSVVPKRVGIRCVHCRLAMSLGHVKGPYERYELASHPAFYPRYFYLSDGSSMYSTRDMIPLQTGAHSFPVNTSHINRTCVSSHLDHFLAHCPYFPEELKEKLRTWSHDAEGKPIPYKKLSKKDGHLKYYRAAAERAGLVDIEGGGVRFISNPIALQAKIYSPNDLPDNLPSTQKQVRALKLLSPDSAVNRRRDALDAECREAFAAAISDVEGGTTNGLILPEDIQLCTDLKFMTFAHMSLIHVNKADMKFRNKKSIQNIYLGFAGFGCRHCGNQAVSEDRRRKRSRKGGAMDPTSQGRFFPTTYGSLDARTEHLLRCQWVPDNVKICLTKLQDTHKQQSKQLRRSSHTRLSFLLWCRLRDADKEVKQNSDESEEDAEDQDEEEEPEEQENEQAEDMEVTMEEPSPSPPPAPAPAPTPAPSVPTPTPSIPSLPQTAPAPAPSNNRGNPAGIPSPGPTPQPAPTNIARFNFVQSPTGWFVCKQCCMVPLDLRAAGAVMLSPPTDDVLAHHRSNCKKDRFELQVAVRALEGLAGTVPGMTIDDVVHPSFKAIVRELVAGNEFLVWAFTDGVKASWYGEGNAEYLNPPGLWCLFPPKVDEEAVSKALKNLPLGSESGPSSAIVANKYFIDYVHLIAPGYKLPTLAELING